MTTILQELKESASALSAAQRVELAQFLLGSLEGGEEINVQADGLQERINLLESKVNELSKPGSFLVPITTLAPEPYDLLKEIKVVVQSSDEEFLASFFDANVNASGCNETEAVENLKDMLLRRLEYLESLPSEKLGVGPSQQLAVLRCFIRRRSKLRGQCPLS